MADDLERLEAALSNAREDDCGNDELCRDAAAEIVRLRVRAEVAVTLRDDAIRERNEARARVEAAEAERDRLRQRAHEALALERNRARAFAARYDSAVHRED